MRTSRPRIVVTCEHASARVPRAYAALFAGAELALRSHEGADIGALAAARVIARALDAPLFAGEVTRLLVDLNRSPHHRGLHSRYVDELDDDGREALLARYYRPFRAQVGQWLRASRRRALHLGIHSFTPHWLGKARACDIGVLYDPARPFERRFAEALCAALRDVAPALRVRRNYPYRGIADGHTTALRRVLPDARYAGLEIEFSQALLADATSARAFARIFLKAFEQTLADVGAARSVRC